MKIRSNPAPLPKDRVELLKVILKEHFFDIVICSFYIFAFAFPMMFWIIYVSTTNIVTITPENYLMNSIIMYLPLIPGIMLMGLGITGSLYFFKRLVFQEGSNVHQDFFIGIKKNIKQALLSFFVIGLFYFLLGLAKNTLILGTSLNEYLVGAIIGLMYVALLLLLVVISFILTQSILYNATQSQLITNSVRFMIGKPLRNLAIFIILFLPFMLYEFLPFNIAHWIVMGVCAIWYFGINSLIFTIYSHYLFDLSINKKYPEIYRKGLAPIDNETKLEDDSNKN